MSEERDWLTFEQARQYLGVSVATMRRREKKIPHYKEGGRVLFLKSDLEDYFASRRKEPAKPIHRAVTRRYKHTKAPRPAVPVPLDNRDA